MYQTFTGSGRRPRNVNLSGRPSNPFAKADPAASGAQQAIASAQQDRLARQHQRERIQASSRIQKVWRAHRTRRRIFRLWREAWDQVEDKANGAYQTPEDSLQQLWRLTLFFSPRREPRDVQRLAWYGTRQFTTSETVPCAGKPWPLAYSKLQQACIAALRARERPNVDMDRTLLNILAFAARQTDFTTKEAIEYYEALTIIKDLPPDHLQGALLAPLKNSAEAYTGLVVLLSKPLDTHMLTLLRAAVNPQRLSEAVVGLGDQTASSTRDRLWLLGNTVYLTRQSSDLTTTAAISRLLGSLAEDVDFEASPIDMDNETYHQDILSKLSSGIPLNKFLGELVLTTLLDQHAIRNLLSSHQEMAAGNSAQILASYALTLLRCFPRKADDIRMWLHLGPTSTGASSPTGSLWNVAKQCKVFSDIWSTSRGVVPLLKTTHPSQQQQDDWTVILVFLEMFTFDLKIMDDEEFMGTTPVLKRRSAVPVAEVARLVTFLKNLGFTLYFDASDLNDHGPSPARDERAFGSSRLFGDNVSPSSAITVEKKPITVARLPGLTLDYLKGLVTGLMRTIYERDSRRSFLPKEHWLMTDRFDMQAFIPGVVAEEEWSHDIQDGDEEDRDDDSDDDEFDPINTNRRLVGGGHARVLRTHEARERAALKARKKRLLASMAPRLEILQNLPFFIPFETRVEVFRQFVHHDQTKRRNGYVDPDMWRQNLMFNPQDNGMHPPERYHAQIKRSQEFSDAYKQFYELGARLKEPIQITFVDKWDMPEAGIDGGGVTKEFLTSVISQAFDQEEGRSLKFFAENGQHLLYPNPAAFENLKTRLEHDGLKQNTPEYRDEVRELHKQYEFLGRIIGKCLYEGILIDVSFAGFFLKQWALSGGAGNAPNESHYRPSINDLRELDEDIYRSLLQVKNAEDVRRLDLTFTVDEMYEHNRYVSYPLAPNGANTPVTNENRLSYINRYAAFKLQTQSRPQTMGFLRGLGDIIPPSWLSMFNQTELQTLIGGASASIDVQDLRKHTQYGGTYLIGDDGQEHPSVKMFWNVMTTFPDEDRRKVLKFVTSTPRGPLLGFDHLNPKFSIRDNGSDENRYPTTSTCVNLLKLPMYKSERALREKLLAAVNSGAGFDLS